MKTSNLNIVKNSLTVSLLSSVLFLASCQKDELVMPAEKTLQSANTAKQALPVSIEAEPGFSASAVQTANPARINNPLQQSGFPKPSVQTANPARINIPIEQPGFPKPNAMQSASADKVIYLSNSTCAVIPVADIMPTANSARASHQMNNNCTASYPEVNSYPLANPAREFSQINNTIDPGFQVVIPSSASAARAKAKIARPHGKHIVDSSK